LDAESWMRFVRRLIGYTAAAVVVLVLLSWSEAGDLNVGVASLVRPGELARSTGIIVFFVLVQVVMFHVLSPLLGPGAKDGH
jgi:hypothetical protein